MLVVRDYGGRPMVGASECRCSCCCFCNCHWYGDVNYTANSFSHGMINGSVLSTHYSFES